MIPHATASANILRHVETGTLIQGGWHRRRGGVELACLLGSIDPSVKTTQDCNAELMPLWLAETSLVLFDGLPRGSIGPVARRYGTLIAQWHVLVPIRWDAILMRFLIRAIDDAVDAARPTNERKDYWPAVEAACVQTKEAITSGGQTAADAAAWAAAGDAARAADAAAGAAADAAWAANAAAWAAARAAEAAAGAADAAAWAADAAAWAAGAAAWTAAWAAGAAADAAWTAARDADAAAWTAAWTAARDADAAAWTAARAAACERLFMFLLDQIEAEIGSAS